MEKPRRNSARRKRYFLATLVLSLAFVLSACTATSLGNGYSEEDPLVLRYADFTNASASGPLKSFATQATKDTNGRLEFKEYWGGSLLEQDAIASGVRAGVADLGMFTATSYPSEYPFTDWIANLGNVSSTEFPEGVLQANAAQADFAMNSKDIREQFENRGIKLLYSAHPITKYDLLCTTPVTSLADAKGKRVRSGGGVWDDELQAIGMIPVSVPATESYEALQRGVLDCSLASPKMVTGYGLWDIAKYHTTVPLSGINAQYVVMNQGTWDSLSEEDQNTIWDLSFTWWLDYMKYEGLGLEQELLERGKDEKNVEFLQADDELVTTIEDFQKEQLAALSEKAPDFVENPDELLDEYISTMDYWQETVQGLDVGEEDDVDLEAFAEVVKREVWDRNRP